MVWLSLKKGAAAFPSLCCMFPSRLCQRMNSQRLIEACGLSVISLTHPNTSDSIASESKTFHPSDQKERLDPDVERKKLAEWCPRSQFNGLKFLQESSKKITHLFSAHMPRLTQIARSTVLRMQICFAWKSIWSCSKESRTALLLSPPRPAHARLPLAVYLLSRGKHFHQLRTHGRTVSGAASPRTA